MSKIDHLIQELCPNGVEFLEIDKVCIVFNGYAFKSDFFNTEGKGIPVIRIRDVNTGFSDTYYSGAYDDRWVVNDDDILIGMDGDFRVNRWRYGKALLNQRVCRLQEFSVKVIPSFVYYKIQDVLDSIHSSITGSTVKHLSSRELGNSKIPVPPLEVQREIVRILDKFTQLEVELEAELEARKQQYEHYRNQLFSSREDTTLWPLGELVRIRNGKDHKHLSEGNIPVYGSGGIMRHVDVASATGPSVLIPRKGSLGNLFYVEGPFWNVDTIFNTEIDRSLIEPKFLFHQLSTMKLGEMNQAGGVPSQTQSVLNRLQISVPPLEEQERIVTLLDKFDSLVNDLSVGLPAELSARRQQYEYYRDKLLSFKELE